MPQGRGMVSGWRGGHGNTVTAVALSGQPHMHAGLGLPMGGFPKLGAPGHHLTAEPGETGPEFSARMAAEFEKTILDPGPDTIAAFFADPMQSGGGAIRPPEGYWQAMCAASASFAASGLCRTGARGRGRTPAEGRRSGTGPRSCARALSAPDPAGPLSFMPPLTIAEDEIAEATGMMVALFDNVRDAVRGRA